MSNPTVRPEPAPNEHSQIAPPSGPPSVPPVVLPPAPPQKTERKTLAIVALVLGIVGFIMACIPFVTWFAGIALLGALVLSLVALFKKNQGGKGFSIAGLALSVIGGIVSIFVGLISLGLLGQSMLEEGQLSGVYSGTEGTASAGAEADLVVEEVVFGRSSYDESVWWFAVILENPNEDFAFEGASIEALDSNGTILDTSSSYQTFLSGRSAIAGEFYSVGDSEIDSLDVRFPSASEATRISASDLGTFEVTDIAPTTDDYFTTIHGKVTSTFAEEQELIEVVVIARDAAGSIIASGSNYVERIPSEGSAQFEVMFSDPLPADTTYEAYAAV
ncbi:DUF4190 domain-containing protein [Leucobacter denitrificans]|uniref:DUF4190 domain-containing protein n=1 Tax=Leucobacter denitrificans TaxID=683042 RepID=A0A7G9S3I6_9MICO|nr:DUF4190 domain-containing protein [Leucobacter denitrificans]QNN62411.1 DUF4190 domain-containing protein [Leucobacter denitrificans]